MSASRRVIRVDRLSRDVPRDDPGFTRFLVQAGIDSISVAPDSFAAVKNHVAAAEQDPVGAAVPERR